MTIAALVTFIRTNPVKAVEVFLYSLKEMVAGNDRVRDFARFCSWVLINVNI